VRLLSHILHRVPPLKAPPRRLHPLLPPRPHLQIQDRREGPDRPRPLGRPGVLLHRGGRPGHHPRDLLHQPPGPHRRVQHPLRPGLLLRGALLRGLQPGLRLFLRRLKVELKLPVLALVDSDPYGVNILPVYMFLGSKTLLFVCVRI
jgi:hypothetical protein